MLPICLQDAREELAKRLRAVEAAAAAAEKRAEDESAFRVDVVQVRNGVLLPV